MGAFFPSVWICLFDCFNGFLWFPEFVCCAENTLVESPWFGLKWLNEWRIGAGCVWIVELHGDDWIGLVYWLMIRVIVVKSPCFVVLSAPGGRLDNSIRFVWMRIADPIAPFAASHWSPLFIFSPWLVAIPVFFWFFCSGILSGICSPSFPFLSFCFVREQVCSLLSGEDCDGAENFL